MQKYSEHILHSLNSPYNIHFLNLVNSISSVDVSNLNQFEINLNNTFKDIAKTLKVVGSTFKDKVIFFKKYITYNFY